MYLSDVYYRQAASQWEFQIIVATAAGAYCLLPISK